jgi:hypothetical protein
VAIKQNTQRDRGFYDVTFTDIFRKFVCGYLKKCNTCGRPQDWRFSGSGVLLFI